MQIVITPCLSELYHSFQSLAPCSGPHEVCFLCNHYLCRAYRPQIIFLTDDLNCFLQTHSYIMSATYKQNKKCFILCPLVFLFPYFTEKKKKNRQTCFFGSSAYFPVRISSGYYCRSPQGAKKWEEGTAFLRWTLQPLRRCPAQSHTADW